MADIDDDDEVDEVRLRPVDAEMNPDEDPDRSPVSAGWTAFSADVITSLNDVVDEVTCPPPTAPVFVSGPTIADEMKPDML